ncbi:pyruvate, phosphate dikinase [Oceanidesulfovibrio indonesiensis]|uniref:Phosphoenolpyruvate synthase n=1 Tax=Oceanidesulfovibrio indonesiensis TaxID=54767 RepID=A0A7M3MH74_9BACT|nr:PEP/pyruvate-binding domain-containing protein [Oceanidesulfovibrio indonesiensis]TVM18839.1 pyruvate, phosphate dikinase [Oceanidesulfovibrio indonesiensis]
MASQDTPLLIDTSDRAAQDPAVAGGKAAGIARLGVKGLPVVAGLVVTTHAYRLFLKHSGLDAILASTVEGKDFRSMRWEAVWDVSLEIRNRFRRARISDTIRDNVLDSLAAHPQPAPLALRSSASSEDAPGHSFAGLHDSFLDLPDAEAVVDHLPLLFASLWSDRALLYRSELGLDPSHSGMAGLIQPMIAGRASGICFTRSPMDERRLMVEAHDGPGIELVSGEAEPARWTVDRHSRRILDTSGSDIALSESNILDIADLALRAEHLLGTALDIEWVLPEHSDDVLLLQARPVTSLPGADENAGAKPWERKDRRPWEMSLRRSFGQLQELRRRVENEIIPAMQADARKMHETESTTLDDQGLAGEIKRRLRIYRDWNDRYYEECVPLAHAVRLLGQVYNDRVAPDDPFAFRDLLVGERLEGVVRNEQLEDMADLLRQDPALRESVGRGEAPDSSALTSLLDEFMERYGELTCHTAWCAQGEAAVLDLIHELSKRSRRSPRIRSGGDAERIFLGSFPEHEREFGSELLELARAAHRMRDDDNLALGRVEAALMDAVEEGRRRLVPRLGEEARSLSAENTERCLRDPEFHPDCPQCVENRGDGPSARRDEVHGQAAGPGIAQGPARIVRSREDIYALRNGEVLVCDSVDPMMTFAVPLAAAIVERRGGMLVHGAIIAREYGLPCVTGVADATEIFQDGEMLLVNGEDGVVRRIGSGGRP